MQPNSKRTKDTTKKLTIGADSQCESGSPPAGVNLEGGSANEVEVPDKVLEEVQPQMSHMSSKSKSGVVRTSTGHNMTLSKKQLPHILENRRTIGAVEKEEGPKCKEKDKRLPKESASDQVLKKTFEKCHTRGKGPSEEEIGSKQKRKEVAVISNDKEQKKNNSKWLLLPVIHCCFLDCCF
jgi:hypothetical protein